jgi:hypothetical protein
VINPNRNTSLWAIPHLEQPLAQVTLAADGVHARAAADGQRIELKAFNAQSRGNLREV